MKDKIVMKRKSDKMIDLHMHTNFSDGTDNGIEILEKAQNKALEVISITDHNTAKVYEAMEKINVKEYYNGEIILGIELNTKVLDIPIEILGYGMDYKKMNEMLKEVYIPAEKRNKIEVSRLYAKCIKAGIKLEENCIEHYDSSMFASKFIQGEIQKFEENKSIISEDAWNDTRIFYRKYMSNPECALYVEMDDFVPDFNRAANLIREAGGLVFIPHIFEYRENAKRILEYILENYKIDGIECYYTTFSEEQTNELVAVCKKHNLYMSGGSDYHGKAKPNVDMGSGFGNLSIDNEIIEKWKDKVRYYR